MSLRADFIAACLRREAAGPLPRFDLSISAALALVGQLQLALRHPANNGDTSILAEGFTRAMIDALAIGPDAAILRKGLEKGFDPDADQEPKGQAARADWFRRWYRSMPESWRAGLWEAIHGGAWLGELPSRTAAGTPPVGVLFLPLELARRVAEALEHGELP
jgi:hypothetical protein